MPSQLTFSQLLEYLVGKHRNDPQPRTPRKYGRFSLMLEFGREFKYAPKPKHIQWGEPGYCYHNAYRLMLRLGLTYCEGLAVEGPISTDSYTRKHAWVVDPNGNVIDNTWQNVGVVSYFGIPFTRTFVLEAVLKEGCSGFLNDNSEPYEKGIPMNVIATI